AGVCGTSCAGGEACNGGCCDGTSCQTSTNACNGCGAFSGMPLGTSCGTCGSYVCAGPNSTTCSDPGLNACGACGAITGGAPGGSCDAGAGACGVNACDGGNAVVCTSTAPNACGGCGTLAGTPGDNCIVGCQGGCYVCSDAGSSVTCDLSDSCGIPICATTGQPCKIDAVCCCNNCVGSPVGTCM
ncbi:MAG: hypothetical protein ABSE49_29690, partial [Polyangiaceae bacterium]